MKITSAEFEDTTSQEAKEMILNLVEHASNIDEIIERWVNAGHGHIGFSAAIDDDDKLMPNTTTIYFDTETRTELGFVLVSHAEFMKSCPDAVDLESFITRPNGKDSDEIDLYDEKFDQWASSIGLKDSYALMCRIGPKRSLAHLVVTFASSPRGIIEVGPSDPSLADDADYGPDLAEEGIQIGEYLQVHACILHSLAGDECANRTMLDTIYCHK